MYDRSLADYADLHDAEVPEATVWQVLHDVAKVSQHVYRHIITLILCTLTAGADTFTQCGPGPPIDVKPDNILLGTDQQYKLRYFSIAVVWR